MIGSNVHCNGYLIGILIFNDRWYEKEAKPIYIIQRFDYYEPFINNMRMDRARTPAIQYETTPSDLPTLPTRDPFASEEILTEDANRAWDQTLSFIKLIAIGFLAILVLGFFIRVVRRLFVMICRKFCGRNIAFSLFKGPSDKKLHARMVPAFYTIVLNVLYYMFQPVNRGEKIQRLIKNA